jgi:hypothetical protein
MPINLALRGRHTLLAELCTISTIVRPGRQVPGLLIYRYDASSGSLHAGRALVEGLRVVRADLVVTDVGRVTLPPNAATERSVDGRWEDAGETEQDAGKWS